MELKSQINIPTVLYGEMKQGMFFLEENHSSLQKQYCIVAEAAQRYFLLNADEEIHAGSLPVGILRML